MADVIERVCLTHLRIPFKVPFQISGREAEAKNAILVTIETAGGLTGVGECSTTPEGWGAASETPERCWDDLAERIAPGLLGQSITEIGQIDTLARSWEGSKAARAGGEMACWDLLGHQRQMSLAELFGGDLDRIENGIESGLAIGLYPTVVDVLRTIERHLDLGYKRVKVEIRPGHDVEVIEAIRLHFGDELPLMVEADEAYTRDDIDIFRRLDDHALLMYEQPFPADDLDGLAALQEAVLTPVCLDETADDLDRAAEAIRRGSGRIVNLKLQRLGGIGPALALNELCVARGVACWVGTAPDLGIGQAHGIHLATLPNCKYPADLEPSARWFVDDYVSPLIEFATPGILGVPPKPGIGYQVDRAKVHRYQVRHQEFTAH